jgi:putative hydrolase of the HAD superfamily
MESYSGKRHETIDTVIFDIGGVLLDWNPRSHLLECAANSHVADLFMDRVFLSPHWNDLDRGTLSLEEGARFFREKVTPHEELFDAFWPGIFDILTPLETNVRILEKLRLRGYRLLMLSNFIEEGYHYVRSKYDFFSLFHGGVISWEIRALKPEPEIYDTLIQRYDLDPSRSFFIDDRKENVEGAQARGLQALHYIPPKPLEEYLSFLLP